MKNILLICFGVILFSTGIILGSELNSIKFEKEIVLKEKENIDSVQDMVMKNIQKPIIKEEEKNLENTIKEVSSVNKKISPYAKLKIEKYFNECGHTVENIIDVPKELINMTKEELQNKYDKWEIKKFDGLNIHLYREISANCPNHYIVKTEDNLIKVFSKINDEKNQLFEMTDIDYNTLKIEDKELFDKGIEIYGEEELSSFLEDFNS